MGVEKVCISSGYIVGVTNKAPPVVGVFEARVLPLHTAGGGKEVAIHDPGGEDVQFEKSGTGKEGFVNWGFNILFPSHIKGAFKGVGDGPRPSIRFVARLNPSG